MQVSAEMRYWWADAAPSIVRDWFHAMDFPPGGGRDRDDEYLLDPDQLELGLKRRGGKAGVEVKGLVQLATASRIAPFTGRVEIWTKWTSNAIRFEGAPVVLTRKTRWLRKYDTSNAACRELPLDENEKPAGEVALPENGCNMELTRVRLDGTSAEWWTLGFEAFGSLDDVIRSLGRTLAWLAPGAPARLITGASEASYPEWLARISRRSPER